MNLKKILAGLIVIILFPALFYTAYEFSTLSENEQMLSGIYERQISTVLYSVNQYAWDVVETWRNRIRRSPSTVRETILQREQSVQAVWIADSSAESTLFWIERMAGEKGPSFWADSVDARSELLRNAWRTAGEGYSKINTIARGDLLMLFYPDRIDGSPRIVAIIINISAFLENTMRPKIEETSADGFNLGVYRSGEENPRIATGEVREQNIRARRRLWVLPGYELVVALQGNSPEQIAVDRFQRSLTLIVIIDIILIIGVVFLYRGLRRQLELTRMKNEFVSNVSHELRTPLALIRMYAETLELGRVKEERKQEYFRIIGRESERLTYLINNILDFAKMEAGKKRYNMEACDLNKVIRETLEAYHFQLESREFKLNMKLSEKPLTLNADRLALAEAFINLLDNAMKYSGEAREIGIASGSDDGRVWFSVSDKGIGIAPRETKRIFEQFYRISEEGAHNTKGSGLGLTLVKYIVNAHNGDISVDSTPGKGSTFRVALPAGNDKKEDKDA